MGKVRAFLSHKAIDRELAKEVRDALSDALPFAEFFLCEEIRPAKEFRSDIWDELTKAKFFVFLYTGPLEDWSWCCFEAGAYKSRMRPMYCLHHRDVQPPSPLSDLQTTPAEADGILLWLETIRHEFKRRAAPKRIKEAAAKRIEHALAARPVEKEEQFIKPYIWIRPRPPEGGALDLDKIPTEVIDNASIAIDAVSAAELGFRLLPNDICLIDFLKRIDFHHREDHDTRPYWIDRFINSTATALKGDLHLQEVAYFRNENGKIYRPIVVSVAQDRDGLKMRVVFAHAFSPPMDVHTSPMQRLADGIRLSVRTKIEILDEFSTRLAAIHSDNKERQLRAVGQSYSVADQVIIALQAIMEEARASGINPTGPAPQLFDDATEQSRYSEIRAKAYNTRQALKEALKREEAGGLFLESERLLINIRSQWEDYLNIALPRLTRELNKSRNGT